MALEKPTHTVILDTGPIIKGDPNISSLRAQSEQLITLPAVVQEIRDEATRSRLQTTLSPFLQLRAPKESSVKVITDFARKTGDLSVLSRVDIQLLALTYDLECERNGGDWRLRKSPGEKRINGPKPSTEPEVSNAQIEPSDEGIASSIESPDVNLNKSGSRQDVTSTPGTAPQASDPEQAVQQSPQAEDETATLNETDDICASVGTLQLTDTSNNEESSDSDSEGWITPSNLKKKQAEADASNTSTIPEPKVLQVALLTSDYAMQNVALQMNLNLLSPSLHRVRHIKTFMLRCHACFNVVKDTSKQFCPRCGKPTLMRVSCSTDQNGVFKMHLKKNMQWNKRGDRFSVPKPVAGAANGRVKGGGKQGWGNDLILAEDQKEYVRAVTEQKREKQKDFMDENYLPGILTGNRSNPGGRIKVGAGRNVNSKKRR